MTQIKSMLTRANALAAAGVLVFAAVLAAVPTQRADALALINRSLTVTSTNASDDLQSPDGFTYSGLTAGDPRNGAQVGHVYTFTPQSATAFAAITIQYCDTPFGWAAGETCDNPTGFDAAAWDSAQVTVTEDVGTTDTSELWDVEYVASVSGGKVLILTPAAATTFSFNGGEPYEIDFTGALDTGNDFFVNPTTAYFSAGSPAPTYFAHIATHNSATPTTTNNGTLDNTYIDDGTVTNNITESISIYTRVQETLNFSVEGEQTYNAAGNTEPNGPVPGAYGGSGTCTALDPTDPDGDTLLRLGDSSTALATDTTYTVDSYFRLATNAVNGASVAYSGDTLKSGGGTLSIDPFADGGAAASVGNEQFGLAFVTAGTAGTHTWNDFNDLAIPTPAADGYDDHTAGYAFTTASISTPRVIATSTGAVQCDTGHLRYAANVSEDTEAGIYTTKINYIATPEY